MPLNPQQKAVFERQVGKMKEDGFFMPAQRSLAGNTRYLIVSYGGTGAAALFSVKKHFEDIIPQQQLEERVRFLAIDTDGATQKHTKKVTKPDGSEEVVELDALSNDQFIQLSGSAARLFMEDANVAEWINPKLLDKIRHDPTMLNNDGASGTRQVGRLTLYPSVTINTVRSRVRKLVGELTNGNAYDLRVFILSGIAGGTGSGTVVDMTYLIRNELENMPGNVDSPLPNAVVRSGYRGFILLPPTGDSNAPVAVQRGNRNGYAALKEINHFMTLKSRDAKYTMTYSDGKTVESGKNIFDVCYLMDGTSDGVAFANPREQAVKVLAESILDMVCASQVTDGGAQVQTVDSFMNDQPVNAANMVASKSFHHAMRDADYLYCALGHSEFAMPLHEIKAYVAKQMFDRVYAKFRNCENVEEDDVKDFLREVKTRGVNSQRQTAASTLAVTMARFSNRDSQNNRGNGKCGPFYVINLLKDVIEEIGRQRNKLQLFRMGNMNDDTLNAIEQTALQLNNSTFDVYTLAMEALREMMGDQFGVVAKAGIQGTSYSFMPASLGSIDNVQHIIKYLDGLIIPANLSQLMENLLQELINNREEWTKLIDKNDPTVAPKAMRRFWNNQLDKLVSSTIEDFLIKYYSGDPDACYSMEMHAQTYPYLQTAANAIYQEMLGTGGKAQPMADLVLSGLQPEDFNAHTFLMVPECAPNLYKELKNRAANAPAGLQVDVCTSMAADRISCYKQYTSIPAFKLAWVCSAEQAYENDLPTSASEGVHMSDTVGGNQWRNFPNLLPRSTWDSVAVAHYFNARENNLANRADTLFDQAVRLHLTTSMLSNGGSKGLEYSVKVLPTQWRPSDDLFRDVDRCPDGSAEKRNKLEAIEQEAQQCAQRLFAKVSQWQSAENVPTELENAGVTFESNNLFFAGSVMSVASGDVRPEHWDEYIAKCMLRKLPDVMNELSGTVMVMEKLMALVNKAVSARTLITQFAQYLATNMFQYNEATQMWQYCDENGFPKDLVFIANDIQRVSEYYYMFDAFRNSSEKITKALATAFGSKVPVMGEADLVTKTQAYIASAKAMQEKLREWNQNPPVDPYIAVMKSAGYDVDAIKRFHLALYNEFTTMAVVGYIPVVSVEPSQAPIDSDSLAKSYLF